MEDQQERHQRITFVLGILVAAVIGFALNIYATVYYEIFMLGNRNFSDYNETATIMPALVLVLSYGFLSFLIYDYKNQIDISRPFLQRLFDYYENVFWPTKVADRMSRFFIFLFKWIFALIVGLTLFQASGVWALTMWIGLILCWHVGKYFYQGKSDKQKAASKS